MYKVPLSQGKFAIVSDEDAEIESYGNWVAHKSGNHFYACYRGSTANRPRTWMHALVLERILNRSLKKGEIPDHINGDKLDNRRENIRLASRSQNEANKPPRGNCSSRFKGVCWDREKGLWRCMITINKRRIHIGYYKEEEDAAKAYNSKAKDIFGPFARRNL